MTLPPGTGLVVSALLLELPPEPDDWAVPPLLSLPQAAATKVTTKSRQSRRRPARRPTRSVTVSPRLVRLYQVDVVTDATCPTRREPKPGVSRCQQPPEK